MAADVCLLDHVGGGGGVHRDMTIGFHGIASIEPVGRHFDCFGGVWESFVVAKSCRL